METLGCFLRWEYLAAFRPSYQGWKRPSRRNIGDALHAFRPSYQGWKHESRVAIPAGRLLLDLPIRDGNLSFPPWHVALQAPFRPSYQGWKLLTGRHDGLVLFLLLDLPIRDGNFHCAFRYSSALPSFRPSYQGWKPDYFDYFPPCVRVF